MERLYAITGATSHLGQTIIQKLIESKQKIRCLIHKTTLPSVLRTYPIEIVEGSLGDLESLRTLVDYPGEVVLLHLAERREYAEDITELMFQTNVVGTQNVIDVCFEKNVHRLLYLSSVEVLRKPESLKLLKEVQYYRAEGVVGGYGKSKAIATQMILDAGKTGLNVTVFSPSILIGPNDYRKGLASRFILDFLDRKIKFTINGGLDLVDVRDVAAVMLQAVGVSRPQEVYFVTGHYIQLEDFIAEIARLTRRKKVQTKLPDVLVKNSLETIGKIGKLLRVNTTKLEPLLVEQFQSPARFTSNKAIKELDLQNRPLSESIRDTIQFFIDKEVITSQVNLKKNIKSEVEEQKVS